jgi:kynureninase
VESAALPTDPLFDSPFRCPQISAACLALGAGEIGEAILTERIWPLFTRVRGQNSVSQGQTQRKIYLANHSLGRPLDRMAEDVRMALDLWYERLDGAWSDPCGWLAASTYFRRQVAELLGAASYQQVIPKTSAGQGLRAVLNALSDHGRVPRVVATRGEFDSCDMILKTYASKGRAEVRWVSPLSKDPIEQYSVQNLIAALRQPTDLVLCSQVLFATGQVLTDLPPLVAAAHEVGALVMVDTYHSFGVLPLQWEGPSPYSLGGADFLIGGSYKYARGGPGACWLAIHPRHLLENDSISSLTTLDTGWFAKQDPFRYERPEPPQLAAGGDAWLESTPPVLTAYQANAGLQLLREIGVGRLQRYNIQQQQQLQAACRDRGLAMYEPSDWQQRGAFALLPHPHASDLSQRLLQRGLNTDARAGCVRFGPDLLTTADELQRAAEIVKSTLQEV